MKLNPNEKAHSDASASAGVPPVAPRTGDTPGIAAVAVRSGLIAAIRSGPLAALTDRSLSVGERTGLSAFGLAFVGTILAALATTSMVSLYLLQRYLADHQLSSAAPIMSLISTSVRENITSSPEKLRQLVENVSQLPNVRGCTVTVFPDGQEKELRISSGRSHSDDFGQQLKAEIFEKQVTGSESSVATPTEPPRRLGLLEITYDRAGIVSAPAIMTALWTAAGAVGVVSLTVFALFFRRLTRRMRPIAFVRDNLLAFHSGAEQSLELLAVNDSASSVALAWNSLIGFMDEMQRELDQVRCRQMVANSIFTSQSQAGQAILDSLPIGILHIDAEESLTYWNYAAAGMLGLAAQGDSDDDGPPASHALAARLRDTGLLETIRTFRHGSDAHGDPAASAARLKLSGSGHIDYELCQMVAGESQKTGTVVRLHQIPVADRNPELVGDDLILMVQDVSQMIEAERSRDGFLAHITHELRTPLTNIRAYAETLTEEFFDDEKTRRECYNVITSETRRLSRLIEDVLSVSQIEAGVSRFERVSLRLDQSLRTAVQEVQANADSKSIELGLRIPSKVPPVIGDRMRLHQVWVNLLGNAVKYTPDGGSVTVSIQSDESLVRVCVTDSGPGIAKEHQAKIFEKFYRVPEENHVEGTGLGLSIARDIVRMHGGVIHVESVPGSGSTFIVELPRGREGETGGVSGEVEHGTARNR